MPAYTCIYRYITNTRVMVRASDIYIAIDWSAVGSSPNKGSSAYQLESALCMGGLNFELSQCVCFNTSVGI